MPAKLTAEKGVPDDDLEYIPADGDHRKLVLRHIRERRGQDRFRNALRKRYADHCAVTGCEIVDLLEAAHVNPYRGEPDNNPANGLHLRADIHTLFDFDLLAVEPDTLVIELHPKIANDPDYQRLAGEKLHCTNRSRPAREALQLRYVQFQERIGTPNP